MRIKADFVTNSSSTAYILYVPSNYELDENDLHKAANEYWPDWEDEFPTLELFKKRILEDFEDFVGNKELWYEDSIIGYSTLVDILVDKFQVIAINVDSSSGQMHLISPDKIKEIIAVEELIKMKGELNASKT